MPLGQPLGFTRTFQTDMKHLKSIRAIAIMSCIAIMAISNVHAQAGAANLRCEHLTTPIGIDAAYPRLSWLVNDDRQGAVQTAYQVWVSKDSAALANGNADSWNSGKTGNAQNLVTYAGSQLQPYTRYYWKVQLWDAAGKPLPETPVSWFETGLMEMTNWKGSWISDGGDINKLPAPYFRKKFALTGRIRSARAYIAAAGLYELYINGKRTGDHRLDPMYTRFDRRNLYVSYDVTAQLQDGANCVGVVLGNGWYNHQSHAVWNFDRAPWRQRPTFCMDLRITYEDGTTQTIATDASWKQHAGPIIFNSIYTGEHYDSRLEMPGWSTADFIDSLWHSASLRSAPSRQIVSQAMTPIRNVEAITPVSMMRFSDTDYVFNLGRNMAGVTKVKLNGDSGTIVRLIHGERLYPANVANASHVDQSNIDVYHRPKDQSDPFQTDIIILNGHEVEFMPAFNYKGFQYVEVKSSKPIHLQQQDLTAYFMHSDVLPAGNIQCSNPTIVKIWEATNNAYLSNLMGYPTDCPQREKNGWTGDGHFAVESGLFNFDGITVYEKWLADHRDEQQPNGVLPDIIPTGGWGYGTANGTDWTSTIAIIPWNLYLFYGDSKALSDNYNNIKAYVNYVDGISPNGLTTFGRGDWVPVKSTSSLEYTSSVYFFVDADILAKAARLFGKTQDEARYNALAQKIRKAINDKYFDKKKCSYASGVQTELSMALQWKVVPEEYAARVAKNLAKRVAADGMHLDVGVLGAKAILNALSDNGQAETAYKLAARDTYPSWGWWIKNGATTLYENWNINATMDISLNHMMFGEIGAWLYKGLGGIKPDEQAPGFKNVLLSPHFVTGLDAFTASHNGPQGQIVTSWKRTGSKIAYQVIIPANTTAAIKFAEKDKVYRDGKPLDVKQPYAIVAGKYEFEVTPAKS